MIILKHVTVERFRLLREINLHFPQRGSILIQGPNEAGKSALFESIYFALYGTPLTEKRRQRSLDDLILYGVAQASVTLTLSIGASELIITRLIERGKGQSVTLLVRRPELPEEQVITDLESANERIIAELGRLDGETLRNSCFIEQKGLHRLEELCGSERETTLRKLLGLEKLLLLTEQFKLTPRDEQLWQECNERLKLAEIQAQIPIVSLRLGRLEEALDAVAVSEDVAEINQQAADIAEQTPALEAVATRRTELKSHQQRISQLKKANATLGEIIAAYDSIAEAQRELPVLNHEIAELERREREELPGLEQRVHELADLTRSFGTLERMSNDLLTVVGTIKELEKEIKDAQNIQEDSLELDAQIHNARLNVEQARQSFNELEERRRAGRPQLEARLQRLQGLRERLTGLHKAEETLAQRITQRSLAEENSVRIAQSKKEVRETEQELARVEAEAQQAQQRADELETYWRELRICRQLQEWYRLKGIVQELVEAEQHVRAAHQQQEKLNTTELALKQTVTYWLMFAVGTGVLGVILGVVALFMVAQHNMLAIVVGVLALVALAGTGYSIQKYNRARAEAQLAHQGVQEAIAQVSTRVVAREAVLRTLGNRDALTQVDRELCSLGGTVPQSREEAQHLLQAIPDKGENLTDVQQRVTEKRNSAVAAANRVNVSKEAVAARRKERSRLEEQRQHEGWDDIENRIRLDRVAIEDRQHTIAALAGQEGLPIPNFDTTVSGNLVTTVDFEKVLTDAIQVTEGEIASLDGKIDLTAELGAQVKRDQEALDALLALQHAISERRERYQLQNPMQQIERARTQQQALRTALQNLQDSLRQRVKPLGTSFGQAAISNAEIIARKQLEALHISLGKRLDLQSRHATYATRLKECQDALSDHYNRLAKFSGSLGSWIVPPNPFAGALAALRVRCQQEIEEANESGILAELEMLQARERASQAKIALCQQEIEEAQERIATMLVQRNRPLTKEFTFTGIVAIWPLVGEYSPEDRGRLKEERQVLEQDLAQLEQQELALSTQLHTGNATLDVAEAQKRREQQERSYQTKKRANMLLQAASERLLRKMLPRTEYYMQQILPLLTSGRYHDVHLSTEEEEGAVSGGPLTLRVWDTAAGEYVPQSALSGGAADQLSLALRLAFASAALPRELGAAPGFVFLDEPLSSFDRGRTQALVNVVTGNILSQHFEQVFLVSHSSAFDPAMFPYHLYLDGGVVVESNLPVVPVAPVAPTLVVPSSDESVASTPDSIVSAVKVPVPESIAVES